MSTHEAKVDFASAMAAPYLWWGTTADGLVVVRDEHRLWNKHHQAGIDGPQVTELREMRDRVLTPGEWRSSTFLDIDSMRGFIAGSPNLLGQVVDYYSRVRWERLEGDVETALSEGLGFSYPLLDGTSIATPTHAFCWKCRTKILANLGTTCGRCGNKRCPSCDMCVCDLNVKQGKW